MSEHRILLIENLASLLVDLGRLRIRRDGFDDAEDAINARLNFGYAVLRSMVARSLVMAGVNPALGLGHSNMEIPFNLADDFIEPYAL